MRKLNATFYPGRGNVCDVLKILTQLANTATRAVCMSKLMHTLRTKRQKKQTKCTSALNKQTHEQKVECTGSSRTKGLHGIHMLTVDARLSAL